MKLYPSFSTIYLLKMTTPTTERIFPMIPATTTRDTMTTKTLCLSRRFNVRMRCKKEYLLGGQDVVEESYLRGGFLAEME